MSKAMNVAHLCMGCMGIAENKENPCPQCGWLDKGPSASFHQLPPQTILNGKYLVGRVLGEGGFGITYLGWDLNLDMKVAIKEFYPSGFVTREVTTTATVTPFSGDKGEAYLNGLDKFVGEAKSLAKFYNLPGIVSVKDFFKENGTAYIVMEYVEGITLKQYLQKEGGRLPVNKVLEWVKPLIASLSHMHAEGIIHRDISPDNLMITPRGDIKLLDFGAARDISTDGAKSLSVLLKPGYAPEEQYRTRGSQGPWTDVYALCATIYKAITGETPPESMERMHEDTLMPPTQLGIEINGARETALLKGLAIHQKNRYQNMDELYKALIAADFLQDSTHNKSESIKADSLHTVAVATQPINPEPSQTMVHKAASHSSEVPEAGLSSLIPIPNMPKAFFIVGVSAVSLSILTRLLSVEMLWKLIVGTEVGVLIFLFSFFRSIKQWHAAKFIMLLSIAGALRNVVVEGLLLSPENAAHYFDSPLGTISEYTWFINFIGFALALMCIKAVSLKVKILSLLVILHGISFYPIFTELLKEYNDMVRAWPTAGHVLFLAIILLLYAEQSRNKKRFMKA